MSPTRNIPQRLADRLLCRDGLDPLVRGRLTGLNFAAVLADKMRGRATPDHFASQRLKSTPRLALAIVHELDRGIPGHRLAGNRHGVFADRLVDIIIAIVCAADRPFETDRGNRAGTDLLIAIGLDQLRRDGRFLNRRLSTLAMGFRLIADSRDDGERMIGRVALAQRVDLPNDISEHSMRNRTQKPRRPVPSASSISPECGAVLSAYAQTGGNLSFQGRSCSSCAARRYRVASSPKRAENIMPSGNPFRFHASGIDIAGWPDMLNMLVAGI